LPGGVFHQAVLIPPPEDILQVAGLVVPSSVPWGSDLGTEARDRSQRMIKPNEIIITLHPPVYESLIITASLLSRAEKIQGKQSS
jgi:hypothetical protein